MKKTVIITAASKGMGEEISRHLTSQEYQVVLFARSARVHQLATELGGIGVQGDLTNPADLTKLVEKAMTHYGRIDGLVINSGHPAKGDLLSISDEEWQNGINLILLNVVRLCRLIVPIMCKQKSGAIVAISSFAAFEPSLGFPLSSALRAALGSFVKLCADRYAADGVRINALLPGFIDSFEVAHEVVQSIPMKRAGKKVEIANTVEFLLSEKSSYMTGQNLRVDGGLTKYL